MTEPRIYLNSFYPLCCNQKGKKAIEKFGFPQYIDGSCRREPDFENEFPSITSLCRPHFSQKLKKGDLIIYVTNKKGVGNRNLVAILKVADMFDSHTAAANWYKENNLSIPNNIMVADTIPFALEKTHQKMGWEAWITKANSLIKWDEGYQKRAEDHPKVARCILVYRELNHPLAISKINFSRKLIAQNPPILSIDEWNKIKDLIKIDDF